MKITEFRNLIREEVRKVLKEASGAGTLKIVKDMSTLNNVRNSFKDGRIFPYGEFEPFFDFELKQYPDNKDEANEYTLPVSLESNAIAQRQLAKVNSLRERAGSTKFHTEIKKLQQIVYTEIYKQVCDIYGFKVPAVALDSSFNNFVIAFDVAFDKAKFYKMKRLFAGVYRLNRS